MAINMNAVNQSFDNMAETQSQLVNRNVVGYNPQIIRPVYDLAKAKQLMADAGYPNGFKVNVDVGHPRNAQYISNALDQLKGIGIDSTVKIRRAGYTSAADRLSFSREIHQCLAVSGRLTKENP